MESGDGNVGEKVAPLIISFVCLNHNCEERSKNKDSVICYYK
jgi:hypothetical protein